MRTNNATLSSECFNVPSFLIQWWNRGFTGNSCFVVNLRLSLVCSVCLCFSLFFFGISLNRAAMDRTIPRLPYDWELGLRITYTGLDNKQIFLTTRSLILPINSCYIIESLSFCAVWSNDPTEISIEFKRKHRTKSHRMIVTQVHNFTE